LTILLHFLWILFQVFGVVFALKGSKIAWFHLGGLLFSLFINVVGLYCPLTYLETYLRYTCGNDGMYSGPYIAHYLELIIYPNLSEMTIRIGEILFVCVNLAVYAVLAEKYFLRSRLGGRARSLSKSDLPRKGL
jgi:hypothetical protein